MKLICPSGSYKNHLPAHWDLGPGSFLIPGVIGGLFVGIEGFNLDLDRVELSMPFAFALERLQLFLRAAGENAEATRKNPGCAYLADLLPDCRITVVD